jgi:hypothetical protein
MKLPTASTAAAATAVVAEGSAKLHNVPQRHMFS